MISRSLRAPRLLSAAFRAALLIVLPTEILAQTPAAEKQAGNADLVITEARLFDGTGKSAVNNATIVVKGNRIQSVGTSGVEAPPNARVINAAGRFVMPGLIEGHLHSFVDFTDLRYLYKTNLFFPRNEQETLDYMKGRIADKYREYLHYGYTTAISPGDYWPYIIQVRDALAGGEMSGPRLFVAGGLLSVMEGHPSALICRNDPWCSRHMGVQLQTPKQAREWVRKYADSGVDLINMPYDGVSGPSSTDYEIAKAVVDEAHQKGLKVFVDASTTKDLDLLLKTGIDGFAHVPQGRFKDEAQLRKIAQSGLPVQLTYGNFYLIIEGMASIGIKTPKAELDHYKNVQGNARTLAKHGAMLAMGSDLPGVPVQTILSRSLKSLQEVGLSNAEILQAATRNVAQGYLRKDLGTIEKGMLADIIIIDGDPLENINDLHQVQVVIQGGELVVDKRR